MRSFQRSRPQTQNPRSKQAGHRTRPLAPVYSSVLGFDIWMAQVRLPSEWQDQKPAVRTIAVCRAVWQTTGKQPPSFGGRRLPFSMAACYLRWRAVDGSAICMANRMTFECPSVAATWICELRRHFGRVVVQVAPGQTFVITRRGQDVAVLVPAGQHRRSSPD